MPNITYTNDPNGAGFSSAPVEEIVSVGAIPTGNPNNYDLIRFNTALLYFDAPTSTWVEIGGVGTPGTIPEEIVNLPQLPTGNPDGYDLVRVDNRFFYFDNPSSNWVQAS